MRSQAFAAMTGRTAFVVANQLSLLRRADMILVLEKAVSADGGLEELVRVAGSRETALLQLMDLEERAELRGGRGER
jgi:ABC-type multidrug transport system fused ATPase/permease subunit